MNRLAILFLFGLLTVFVEGNAQKVILGMKGGLDFSKISGKYFSNSYSPSFEAGEYTAIRINSKWGIQTELVYSQGIEKINSDGLLNVVYMNDASKIVSSTATIGAITLPILLTYKINNLFSLNAGPAISANIYTNENIFQNGQVAFKTTDLSICGGATLNLSGFDFYFRYTHGLNDINNYNNLDTWKSRRISLGLEIPIKSFK